MTNILIHHGGLGDVLVSLPTIRSFQQHYPGPLLALGVSHRLELLQKPRGPIDRVIKLSAKDSALTFGHPEFLPEILEKARAFLIFEENPILTAKLKDRAQVIRVQRPKHSDLAISQAYLEQLPKDIPHHTDAKLHSTKEDRKHAGKNLQRLGLSHKAFLSLHPGSGSPDKCWPADLFRELRQKLRDQLSIPSLVFLGPTELENNPKLQDLFPDALTPSLTELAALLEASCLHLGNDSGPSHLALAVDCPSITLFGPSKAQLWQARNQTLQATIIEAPQGSLAKLGLETVWQSILHKASQTELQHFLQERQKTRPH